MDVVQLRRRRWLSATLALAVVLASVGRGFANSSSNLARRPARAAGSDSDVLDQPPKFEGDDDLELDEDIEPYSDWEEAEREVSSLLEQTAGLEEVGRSRETAMDELHRVEMVEAIHRSLGDGQPRLNTKALRRFAEMTGFEGNDVEWSQEYELLCAEIDCSPRQGLTVAHLLQLVSDTSGLGTYYSDDELESICNALEADLRLNVPENGIFQEENKKVGKPRYRSKPKFKSKKIQSARRSLRMDPWA